MQTKYTLKYCSSRRDVWAWYWKAWLKRLWVIHVVLAIVISFIFMSINQKSFNDFLLIFLTVLVILFLSFALAPQIMFKKSERVLIVDSYGWSTKVGRKEGSRAWDEVKSIYEEKAKVVLLGKNGNALIIPSYAFSDASNRHQFVRDAKSWKNNAVSRIR